MTEVYRCDKCAKHVDEAIEVGYGGNAHMGQANRYYHVCDTCKEDFQGWFDE